MLQINFFQGSWTKKWILEQGEGTYDNGTHICHKQLHSGVGTPGLILPNYHQYHHFFPRFYPIRFFANFQVKNTNNFGDTSNFGQWVKEI